MKAETDLFKNGERRRGALADNIGKMLGTAITAFDGPFVAEMLSVADLEEGGR